MSSSRIEEEYPNHNKYNTIPVVYCADCLSLKVLTVDGIDYCEECGSTNIKEASIFDWEKLYAAKYKERYINTK